LKDRVLIFHLAIPSRDIAESIEFYKTFGCEMGRQSEDAAIINFLGTQLVIHKSDDWDRYPEMYPRHFGVLLNSEDAYEMLDDLWKNYADRDFVFEPLFIRNKGKHEEHKTFFLLDPSNNLLEFKAYKNSESIFGKGV